MAAALSYQGKLLALGLVPRFLRRRYMQSRYEVEVSRTGESELAELRRLVKPGELALDIGCNLGVYAWELGRLTGRVIGFEPNPSLAGFVEGLGLKGVEIRQIALSSSEGEADLTVPLFRGGHGCASLRPDQIPESAAVEHVKVRTARLDDLGLDPIAFIKIDVEGYEEEVLAGAMETIGRDRPKLLIEIEERQNPGGLRRIAATLTGLGYAAWFLRDRQWHPLAEFERDRHQPAYDSFEDFAQGRSRRDLPYVNNFLFVPAAAGIEGDS